VEVIAKNYSPLVIQAKDKFGRKPLFYSSSSKTAKLLLQSAENSVLDITEPDTLFGLSPLLQATAQNHVNVLKYFLSEIPIDNLMESQNFNSETALHLATSREAAEILFLKLGYDNMTQLLKAGSKNKSWSVVHTAASNDRHDIIRYFRSVCFIEVQALIYKKDWKNRTPLFYAQSPETVDSILEPLDQDEKVSYILSNRDDGGCNALVAATFAGCKDVVSHLFSIICSGHKTVATVSGHHFSTVHHDVESRLIGGSEILLQFPAPKDDEVCFIRHELLAQYILLASRDAITAAKELTISNLECVSCVCSLTVPEKIECNFGCKPILSNMPFTANNETILKLFEYLIDEPIKPHIVFLWPNKTESSVLHQLANNDCADVVKYSLTLTSVPHKKVSCQNKLGKTVLHCAKSDRTALELVLPIDKKYLKALVLLDDIKFGMNSLHIASQRGMTNTVKMCCDVLDYPDVKKEDKHGLNALSHASHKEVAELLLEKCKNSGTSLELLFNKDKTAQTVLHNAARNGHADVISTIRKKLTKSEWQKLCMETDRHGRTLFHYASSTEIFHELSSFPDCGHELILLADLSGRTALHYADDGDIADHIMTVANFSLTDIVKEDDDGHSGLTHAIKHFNSSVLVAILDYTEKNFGRNGIEFILRYQNRFGQNFYHLVCLSPFMEEILDLVDLYYQPSVKDLIKPDIYKNTVFTYLTSTYDVRTFADFVMRLPLPIRRSVLHLKNIKDVDCHAIVRTKKFSSMYYTHSILCDPRALLRIYGGTHFAPGQRYIKLEDGTYECNVEKRMKFTHCRNRSLHHQK